MKETILEVLRNSHTRRVNFTYTSPSKAQWRVYANDFVTVALNIEQGNIDVQTGGVRAGRAKYSLKNSPEGNANTFYIGRNNTTANIFHSLLVHESVHAAYDLKGYVMPWLDNEAIAYIAQGFYLLNAGKDGDLAEQPFWGYKVAQNYQTANESACVYALCQSILNDPLYKKYVNGDFKGDG